MRQGVGVDSYETKADAKTLMGMHMEQRLGTKNNHSLLFVGKVFSYAENAQKIFTPIYLYNVIF